MSIDKITAQIIGDARTEANAVVAEAKQNAEKLVDDAKKKGEEMIEVAHQRGRAEQDIMVSRRKSVAEIDGRKLILEEKSKLIDKCFDDAAERILAMSDDDYCAFLADIVKMTGITKGEIILNDADKSRCGKKLIELLGRDMDSHEFVISEETRKIKGGLMIKSDKVYVNGTLERYMKEVHEAMATEIAGVLFG